MASIIELELQHHHILYVIIFLIIGFSLYMIYTNLIVDPSSGIASGDFLGINNMFLNIEESMTNAFEEFTKNPIFQKIGVLITFLYGMTPSLIPVPNEIFMTPLILAQPTVDEQFNEAIFLIFITSVAGFIGDSIVFLSAKHHIHKIFRRDQKSELESSHWFHKYGVVMYLFSPSLWFAGGLAEVPLVVGGYAQVDFKKMAPFLFGGNLIRGIWGGIILLSVLGLLQ